MHICLHLDNVIIPWESTNQADFVDQSFVRLQAVSRIFRGFDGLYGVSGSKVMTKRLEINQQNSHKSPREFIKNWGLLALTLEPEALESRPRDLKTRIISQNPNKLGATTVNRFIVAAMTL